MLDEHLAPERLARYRAVAGNSGTAAINGYIWNVLVSGAFMELISYVEVPLRNAMAYELAQLAIDADDDRHWWEHREWFEERSLDDIDRAVQRLDNRGREITNGRLVAELNLGFWRYLLDKRHDRTLWRRALYRAFPNLAGTRGDVYRAVVEMNRLRNRIAHHEPIFLLDHVAHEKGLLEIAGWICADYSAWAQAKSRVRHVVALKPAGLSRQATMPLSHE